MRRRVLLVTAAIVLALVGAGAVAANVLSVRDEPGAPQSVEPIVVTPSPSLPTAPGEPTVSPTTPPSPVPVPPAPPADLDDDDDDDPDDDDDD